MFGMTMGAIWIYLRPDKPNVDDLHSRLALYTNAFGLTTVASLFMQSTINALPYATVPGITSFVLLTISMAIPYFFSGAAVSLALTRSPYPIALVYAVDLIGAACGCLVVLGVLEFIDAPSAIIFSAAVAIIGGFFFSCATQRPNWPAQDKPRFTFRALTSPAIVGVLALIIAAGAWANSRSDNGVQPMYVKRALEQPGNHLVKKWNSFSRIAATRPKAVAPGDVSLFMWGPSPVAPPTAPARVINLNIDGEAGTVIYPFSGDVKELSFLEYDVTTMAYQIRNKGRAGVIGVGGGRDVMSAYVFGFRDITGVEINPILVELLTTHPVCREFAGIYKIPEIRLVVDEARSWMTRATDHFDLLQMSLVDTWAATGAGAFSLSECSLYTREAWRVFFSRLTENGVFTVSRWFAPGEVNETGRMVSLAMQSLIDLGVKHPRQHVFLAAANKVATIVVSRSPLTPHDISALSEYCERMKFDVLISPDREPASTILAKIVSSDSTDDLYDATSGLMLDLTPSTDNHPFFFNQLPLNRPGDLIKTYKSVRAGKHSGVLMGNLVASFTLIVVLGVTLILALITIFYPIVVTRTPIIGTLRFGGTIYFALIGLGFMFVEISLLQRLSVFLGHPVYSLSIILFSIILTTGIGSYVSGIYPLINNSRIVIWCLLLAGYVSLMPIIVPWIIEICVASGILARAGVAILVTAPAGFLMGFGFPTGMRLAEQFSKSPTPWLWGVNGAAGVIGSVLAVMVSLTYGIHVSLLIGALCYLLVIPVALLIGARSGVHAN